MIKLEELKNKIETNTLNIHLVIYKCDRQTEFIPHQYAIAFCDNNNSEIIHVNSVSELPHNTLFGNPSQNNLTLYYIDKLDENLYVDQEPVATNYIWVICHKISERCNKWYEDYIVDVPKLQEWQVKDFIKTNCPKLTDEQCDELFSYYGKDLFRLSNEIDKIKLVGDSNYNKIKDQLYVDISNYNVFDFSNSIIRRDKITLSNIYKELDHIDVEPIGLVTLLINNFRHVIDVQLSRNATAESAGVTAKQFWAIKNYSCGYYNKKELVEIFKFLNLLDYKVKSGELDTSMLVDYIVCKIMTI